MAVEVEIRSFITKPLYDQLIDYFSKKAMFVSRDKQETVYYDADVDLRIQRSNTKAKIWLKKGTIHDTVREEIEVNCKREDYPALEAVFEWLDYRQKVKWVRLRTTFLWDGVTVTVDDTQNYGYIIELEKIVQENERESALTELEKKMDTLQIPITSRDEFDHRYSEYIAQWQRKHAT